ncbi:hypothetical protein CLRAG_33480 [Clostridium ragsdalei P11]|uniref:Uncharacterized protein n=1 Tax=Clostridium ragsdalei P11 TaxID=1353534 RepID=A0A1A6AKT9_9CLOT|nr:hypothetical protein [Clostridium ragsdalei]OBR90700.1 hypothetical protein CLRAG_33480 [Clostridium ragsdalei P11]
MCLALEYTEQITNILRDASNEKKRLYNLVHKCDLKTCDLLHEIELTDIKGMYHAWLIIKEIKQVRKIRRKAKDDLEIISQIDSFTRSQKKKFEHMAGSINNKIKKLEKRQYHVRVQEKIQDYV